MEDLFKSARKEATKGDDADNDGFSSIKRADLGDPDYDSNDLDGLTLG